MNPLNNITGINKKKKRNIHISAPQNVNSKECDDEHVCVCARERDSTSTNASYSNMMYSSQNECVEYADLLCAFIASFYFSLIPPTVISTSSESAFSMSSVRSSVTLNHMQSTMKYMLQRYINQLLLNSRGSSSCDDPFRSRAGLLLHVKHWNQVSILVERIIQRLQLHITQTAI